MEADNPDDQTLTTDARAPSVVRERRRWRITAGFATVILTAIGWLLDETIENQLEDMVGELRAVGSAKRKSAWERGNQPRTGVRAQRYDPSRPAGRSPWSVTKTVELRPGKPTEIELIVP